MTTGELLDASSTVERVSAITHLRNLRKMTIMAQDSYVSDEENIQLEAKDDIISLRNEKDINIMTITETEITMETKYGLQESC